MDGHDAFGISKSFKRMKPKYAKAVVNGIKDGSIQHHSMDDRIRYNYAGMREASGDFSRLRDMGLGHEAADGWGRKLKDMANAQVTAAGNISRRAGRKLP